MALLALVVTLVSDGAATASHVPLKLVVENTGSKPERFCVYHTPFEGVRNAFMDVTDADGSVVGYAGIMAKRAPPTKADYRTLSPGARIDARFDLTEGYNVKPGRHTLRFSGSDISGLPASGSITLDIH